MGLVNLDEVVDRLEDEEESGESSENVLRELGEPFDQDAPFQSYDNECDEYEPRTDPGSKRKKLKAISSTCLGNEQKGLNKISPYIFN